MTEQQPLEKDIDHLVTEVAEKIDELIDSKNVVGEKITIGDTTLIPLMAAGFGFGAGGGGGKGSHKGEEGEGRGEGTGGGGGVKPVAIIVVNAEGVRVAPVPGAPSGLEKLGSAIGDAISSKSGAGSEASD